MSPAAAKTTPPKAGELELLRARSRRRARVALATMVLGLVLLVAMRYVLLDTFAREKAAGHKTTIVELWHGAWWAVLGFWLGLLLAFASMLVAVLSTMHARHVEKGIESAGDGQRWS